VRHLISRRSPGAGGRRPGWRARFVILGLAGVLPVLAAVPASAADGSSSVSCATGDSCVISLEKMVQFGGANYSPGANNMVIDIAPPPCSWNPIGDAYTGSQNVISSSGGTAPPPGSLFDTAQTFQQAKQLLATTPMPAGEWYVLPVRQGDTPAEEAACLAQPLYFWDVPGAALPGIPVPPVTLAQLATSKLLVPGAGRMLLSPVTGVSYSNLPVFARVTLAGRQYEIGANGMPYLTDNARLGNNAATVWVEAKPLQLSTTDSSAKLDTGGCGYLGSALMVRNPRAVASTGANGTADCGATFRAPGAWTMTATLTWQTCWVPAIVNGPPPAACNPVPGANLNPVNWARNVNVHEIQAANGAD
jgi:hypothetical protein